MVLKTWSNSEFQKFAWFDLVLLVLVFSQFLSWASGH